MLLFMDVDGTLTDGKLYIGNNGEMMKQFSVKDGHGINKILKNRGGVPVIITARESEIVLRRCEELGIIEVHQGCQNKKDKMIEIAQMHGIELDENGILPSTAYIGDDIPDLDGMRLAQFAGCPMDAVQEVKECADFISTKNGGDGAVRDFIEWLYSE